METLISMLHPNLVSRLALSGKEKGRDCHEQPVTDLGPYRTHDTIALGPRRASPLSGQISSRTSLISEQGKAGRETFLFSFLLLSSSPDPFSGFKDSSFPAVSLEEDLFTVASDSCGVARLGGEAPIVLQLLFRAWPSPPTLPAPLISESSGSLRPAALS